MVAFVTRAVLAVALLALPRVSAWVGGSARAPVWLDRAHGQCRPSAAAPADVESQPALDDRELTKLFGRMADKLLLLDVEGAGTVEMKNCCHGGCDNCPYSRVFDEMRSGRPKWVALYSYRELIDGRNHQSPWADALFGEDASLTQEAFAQRVNELPYAACLGPPKSVPKDEPLSDEAVDALWTVLAAGEAELTVDRMAQRLIETTGEEHGATWQKFKEGLTKAVEAAVA